MKLLDNVELPENGDKTELDAISLTVMEKEFPGEKMTIYLHPDESIELRLKNGAIILESE